jgi:hypothetical protein
VVPEVVAEAVSAADIAAVAEECMAVAEDEDSLKASRKKRGVCFANAP